MKNLVALFILLPIFSFSQFGRLNFAFHNKLPSNGYAHWRTVTVDYTKVSNSNQTNFPILINSTVTSLKTVANGGSIQNTTTLNSQTVPADLIFTSDIGGTTLLNWDIESYTATTGAIVVWVKIPTLSFTANTVIYMFYGKASVTTYQGSSTSTWSNSFAGVYHLPNGTSLSATDASASGINGTINSVTATSGQMDGAGSFSGGNNISMASLYSSPASVTLSAWVNLTTNGSAGAEVISMGDHVSLRVDQVSAGTGVSGFFYAGSGPGWPQINGGSPILNTGWHYVAYIVTANNQKIYLDGVQVNSATNANSIVYTGLGSATKIGIHGNGGSTTNFGGKIDEARISNTIRSVDWLLTEYNNQNSPSTFYTIGTEN